MLLREGMGSGKLREPLVRSRCDRAGAAPRLSASSARVLERGHWRASAAAAEAICAAGKGAAERPGATHGTAPFPVSWGTHGCRLARGPSRSPGRRKISSGNPQVSENSRGPTFGRFSDRDPHLGQISRGPQDVARGPPDGIRPPKTARSCVTTTFDPLSSIALTALPACTSSYDSPALAM